MNKEEKNFICEVCNFKGLKQNRQRHLDSKRHYVRTNYEKVYRAVASQSDPENNDNDSDPEFIPNNCSSSSESLINNENDSE